MDRDGWTCQRCGAITNLTVDHIVPWSKGGRSVRANLQVLCEPCNLEKKDGSI